VMADADGCVPRISMHFHRLDVRSRGTGPGGDGDYLDGEVDFDLVVDGTTHRGLTARVKQAAGSRFADPLEILVPTTRVAWRHYGRYRDCVERYVRARLAGRPSERTPGRPTDHLRDVRLEAEATCDYCG
jgi:hypothetical protein